ncbi:MAG: isoprenylcysteine carboxylmethyltransferase family protein [Hyphomicrobiaceae bacterium]|nr:isoprenylcysteine carboxylmethyltransferase family protein [Hyphomicrobiaceae bacterium]
MFYKTGTKLTVMRNPDPANNRQVDALVRPPTLFLGAFTVGCLLEMFMPIGPGLAQGTARPIWIGLGLAVIGVGIAAKAVSQFTEAGTSVPVHEPTDALVTNGLYALSRNPIYIALIIFYVGLSIALTTGWALLLLPVVLTVLQKGVVEREEALLAQEFGETYLAYKKKVPRWL